MVKNQPCSEGGADSIPGQGTKIQHAWWAATKPTRHNC